ncbi:MAG: hypothetical protein P1U67_10555 [Alcanivoracaceae bacterium]|nr:hypothetical protein [Alcanivoracaceae bacterium]
MNQQFGKAAILLKIEQKRVSGQSVAVIIVVIPRFYGLCAGGGLGGLLSSKPFEGLMAFAKFLIGQYLFINRQGIYHGF